MGVKDFLQSSQEQSRPWVETPLRESYALSQAAGWYGLGHYLVKRVEELPTHISNPHIFCSSGGNAGLAAVHASRTLGVPCTVVVPSTVKQLMVTKIKAAGAYEVLQHGDAWADADKYMREELMPQAGEAAIYAPPFDHPDIWAGNSSIMYEIADQMPDSPANTIICSVGGGGLLNGLAMALDDLSLSGSTTVIGVETAGAESLAAAVHAGQLVTLPRITSQATSLGCARVTQLTLDTAQRDNFRGVVLPDAEAAMGCWRLADDERIMVELACGVNVALCYDGRLEKALGRKVRPDEKVVIVLCGGSNVTVNMLSEWRKEYAYLEEPVTRRKDSEIQHVPQDVPEIPRRAPVQRQWNQEVLQLEAKL
ncbi:catabolic L-serine/threonine dehydratase [Didymosphaeria variabile]|uniref:L-serine ammonia-lyase n=1 Tax=Didymosphaeria variabile TaxID=1932322 RepID=A0A9W8XA19_9PLEO|nr:catabolic L-serine/threonine dehydratase [Didymosphaeria variabile]KAJ4344467.1 catabolic L-serine/threonine dehydratase [Didymosphaeria variabile]